MEGKITKNTLPKFNWINNASYFKRENIYVWKRITDELDESKRGKARGMQFCNIRINRGNRVCVSNIGKFSSPPTSVEGNSKLQTKAIIRGNGEHWTENHLTYRFDLLRPFSLLHLTTVEATNRELLESQRKDRLLDSLSFCIPTHPISRISSELIWKSHVFVLRETISVG